MGAQRDTRNCFSKRCLARRPPSLLTSSRLTASTLHLREWFCRRSSHCQDTPQKYMPFSTELVSGQQCDTRQREWTAAQQRRLSQYSTATTQVQREKCHRRTRRNEILHHLPPIHEGEKGKEERREQGRQPHYPPVHDKYKRR